MLLMRMTIEPSTAVRFAAGSFRPAITTSRRLRHTCGFSLPRKKFQRSVDDSSLARKKSSVKQRVRASVEEESRAKPSRYHPSEDIAVLDSVEDGEARLSPAETARTIIEVNSKGTLMFSGLLSDEVHENIFCPDLPYVTDEHGNIYFQVKNQEDILQTLTAEDNYVQVIIGLDTAELLSEMESEIDFGIDEMDDEDSDDEDDDDSEDDAEDGDYNEDWVTILEDEEDEEDSFESLGDWAKLETMRTAHPMYFAEKLAEVVSDDPMDFMDQPPAGLAIQGLLRPAFVEEHTIIQKHLSVHEPGTSDLNQVGENKEDNIEGLGMINGHRLPSSDGLMQELENGGSHGNGTSFYKLEMINVQLLAPHGQQTVVEVDDLIKAQPDSIAHSAAKIISRLKAGGEKTTQALKLLCWRCKGIQVEEASIIGIDSLGFDLRVCSGTQLLTLRFTFNTRGSSEYSAERQLNDMLFPRAAHNLQKKRQARQAES
ncbi:uncharacterized protein At3g49140-like [Diospyros lotus]|uniref:uncharacterized protein At3g49140-like n=1 Tax=Diospyros lotus TaxID=55363 RepID=UPI00224E6F53|nr:uncharacterized protein At3g49140-like [Diospyros lotus]